MKEQYCYTVFFYNFDNALFVFIYPLLFFLSTMQIIFVIVIIYLQRKILLQ